MRGSTRRYSLIGACLVVGVPLLMATARPAAAVDQVIEQIGPDFLQTLGVGSRSVGMGNAYSAIADDPSATFWNPGRLGVLKRRWLMLHARPGLETTSTLAVRDSASESLKRKAGGLQPTFASFVYPLSTNWLGGEGTIGVSYTLGGYFNLDATRTRTTVENVDGFNLLSTVDHDQLLARNSYLTIGYGHQWSPLRAKRGTLGVGLAYYRITSDVQSKNDSDTVRWNGGSSAVLPPLDPSTGDYTNAVSILTRTQTQRMDRGHGDGVTLGVYYQTGVPAQAGLGAGSGEGQDLSVDSTTWSFAACYRSKATLSGMVFGEGFASEVPDRLSLGVAYNSYMPSKGEASGARDRIVIAGEIQRFSKANSVEQTDFRSAVTNLHLGLEYIPSRPLIPIPREKRYDTPIRLGFRTNKSAVRYAYSDNVISAGIAFIRKGEEDAKVLTIEPTAEYLTKTKQWFFNLTFQMPLDTVVRQAGGEDRPVTGGRTGSGG